MSKVYEALQREKENLKGKKDGLDPLTAKTGAPGDSSNNQDPEAGTAGLDFPVIGAPMGPRSNEGAIFPSSHANVADVADLANQEDLGSIHPETQDPSPSAQATNGRNVAEDTVESRHPLTEKHRSTQRNQPAAVPGWSLRDTRAERLSLTRLHPRLILLTDPHAAECEQYRTLRTQLFHAAEKSRNQIVIITSALAGEGKTSTVLNLALTIAQSKEKRILVVDGDLRRPNIASFLGVKTQVGLGEALKGECDAFDAIFSIEGEELYVLPVSKESDNPTELLSSERLGELISLLRRYFDFILFDSPPVMPFADTRLLANHADSVMLVVRAGMAQCDTIEKAIEALPSGRILGIVLNGAEHIKETGYYDYYYNYSRYDQRQQSVQAKMKRVLRGNRIGRKHKG
jgi:protein-tyrosine kinase